jgi:predicted DNA-binding protein
MDEEETKKTYIMVRLPPEISEKFNKTRGLIPRTKVVRRLIDMYINGEIKIE